MLSFKGTIRILAAIYSLNSTLRFSDVKIYSHQILIM